MKRTSLLSAGCLMGLLFARTAAAEELQCSSRDLTLPPLATIPDNFFDQLSTLCSTPPQDLRGFCERLSHPELAGLEEADLNRLRDWIVHRGKLGALLERRRDLTAGLLLPALTNGGASLAKGFSDFVVQRAEEEAAIYLQEELTERVCGNSELRCAFPRLCELMTSTELRIGLGGMAQALRKAGELDIHHLPNYLLGRAQHAAKDESSKAAAGILRLLWATALAVDQGRQPLAAIAALAAVKDEALCTGACPKELATLRFAAQLIATFSRLEGLNREVVLEQLGMVTTVAALLLETGGSQPGLPAMKFDRESIKKLIPIAAKLLPVILKTSEELQASAELARTADPKLSELRAPSPLISAALLWQALTAARDLLELPPTLHGCTGACATNAKLALEKAELGAEALAQIVPNDPASIFWAISTLMTRLELPWSPAATRAGAVIVELARADSSEGVVQVLQAASAPVGSYRAKYQRPTFALNAFAGGQFGLEALAHRNTVLSTWVGAFVPIGLHASWPVGQQHFGLLAAVVDLGAFASVRLADEDEDTTNVETDPRVAQLFSPGLYLVWGIFESPFVLGLGGSIAPEARFVERVLSNDENHPIAGRAGVFLAVDVTIMPF